MTGKGSTGENLSGDTCEVRPGSGDARIYRGVVLAPEGTMPEGEVATLDDRIACVGEDCSDSYPDASVIDCGRAVISPALINPHEHMSFNEKGPLELGAERYDHRHEWRGDPQIDTPPNPSGTEPGSPGMRWAELRQLLGGTTSVVGSGNASGIIRHLDDLGESERERGFVEVDYETFPLGDSSARNDDTLRPPEDCGWDYKRTAFGVSQAPAYLPHVAEGIDEYAAEEFRCQSHGTGHARDFLQSNASHIHSIGTDAVDLHRMASEGTRLVWSPRSNLALYGVTADVSTFHRLGGTLALGTDWAYTGSANMMRELSCADSFNRDYLGETFSERELWEMATTNAAVATGNAHALGSLEEGKIADLLIVQESANPYRSIIEAESKEILLVTRAGEPLYGDRDVIAESSGAACDPIEVCGEARGLCLREATGESYKELKAAVSDDAYPAFFCGDPPQEPTCVPSRPGEFTGVPSEEDRDGDGVPDDRDMCLEVFHPIRPIDDGQQADADADDIGDACDGSPVPEDISGDGVPNDVDNCPYAYNPDQEDRSGDGKGDACDPCPDVYNPDSVCPPPAATIREVREELPTGETVSVRGAVVTGVYDRGATVQDPDPDKGDPRHSGIMIFSGDQPEVSRGDLVDITGTKEDFFGNLQISADAIERRRSGESLSPLDVTVAEATSDAYQGLLVRITNGQVSDEDYDCSQDHGGCSDENLWEVSGEGTSAVLVFDRLYEGDDWEARVGDLPLRGVMMLRFDRHRIMPRSKEDFR